MKTYEEMARSVFSRRDEELKKLRKRNKGMAAGAAVAALCLLAVFAVPRFTKRPDPADPVQPDVPEEQQIRVVWTTEQTNQSAYGSDGIMSTAALGREELLLPFKVVFEPVQKAADNAEPSEYIAFSLVLQRYHYYDTSDPAAVEKRMEETEKEVRAREQYVKSAFESSQQAFRKMNSVYKEQKDRILSEKDISEGEAGIRANNTKEYIQARTEMVRAALEYRRYGAQFDNRNYKDVLEMLRERGFEVLCTCWDDDYCKYYMPRPGIAVVAGTSDMINALSESDFSEDIGRIFLVPANYTEDDTYKVPEDIKLSGDLKLTDELAAKYDLGGGEAVKVAVYMSWVGEWVDPHVYAYAAVGMTGKQWEEAKDLPDEVVEKYLETLRYYTYWVNEDLVKPLLKDGELVEVRRSQWSFVAMLTRERAMELCENKMVSHICSIDAEEKERLKQMQFLTDIADE